MLLSSDSTYEMAIKSMKISQCSNVFFFKEQPCQYLSFMYELQDKFVLTSEINDYADRVALIPYIWKYSLFMKALVARKFGYHSCCKILYPKKNTSGGGMK